MKYLLLLMILFCSYSKTLGIVPKPGIPLSDYEKAAENMNNIGYLLSKGKKASSCTATLIGKDGNIGIMLTAGHCVDLSGDEMPKKCRHHTVSFQAKDNFKDQESFPVIGRYTLSDYVDKSIDYEHDIGIVFIDMSNSDLNIPPQPILLDPSKISQTSSVYVAGYGKTALFEENKSPKRRIMATGALRTEKNGHETLLLDESAMDQKALSMPIGYHPAEGDSGGPIMDAETHEIIGVVSHKTGMKFYSQPLYTHSEWLLTQIKRANEYFMFHLHTSGKISDPYIWKKRKKPFKFKNPYGAINPIVVVDGNKALELDEDAQLYAIHTLDEGGVLNLSSKTSYIEVLKAKAPIHLQSTQGGHFTVDAMDIESANVKLNTKLHILHQLKIKDGIHLDTQTYHPKRGITLIDHGNLHIKGNLKTHHINFVSCKQKDADTGYVSLSGTLDVQTEVKHNAHVMEIISSSPGKIKGNYTLDNDGVLLLNLDNLDGIDHPILTIEGDADFGGGQIRLKCSDDLPLNFEKTLISANHIRASSSFTCHYSGVLPDNDVTKFVLVRDDHSIKIKSISGLAGPSYGQDHHDDFINILN